MKKLTDFLSENWKFAVIMATVIGGILGIDFRLQKGGADKPTVIVILPDDAPAPAFLGPVGDMAAEKQHWHSRRVLRAHLAVAYARENECGLVEGFRHIRQVSNEDLETALQTAAAQSGQSGDQVFGKIGDGELLKKFIDFLNSPQGQALIKLLLALLIAADHQPTPDLWTGLPADDIRVAQVPYPLAWERPHLALAA